MNPLTNTLESQIQRMLVWFSCGGPSAVAANESIKRYGHCYDVIPVCCDTRPSEHSDNYRFSADVEKWIGRKIVYLRNEDYATVDDVFERHRYMSGIRGARCTTELKKIPRLRFALPDDIHVFGFTFDEQKRTRDFKMRNPDLILKWVLVEQGLTKRDCLDELKRAGIELPAMYRIFDEADRKKYGQAGFDNNNCPGCVKASSPWYWSMIRKYFPSVFKRRCEQSRGLGVRLVQLSRHNRIFLDELPEKTFPKRQKKENMSCGPECGMQLKLL